MNLDLKMGANPFKKAKLYIQDDVTTIPDRHEITELRYDGTEIKLSGHKRAEIKCGTGEFYAYGLRKTEKWECQFREPNVGLKTIRVKVQVFFRYHDYDYSDFETKDIGDVVVLVEFE